MRYYKPKIQTCRIGSPFVATLTQPQGRGTAILNQEELIQLIDCYQKYPAAVSNLLSFKPKSKVPRTFLPSGLGNEKGIMFTDDGKIITLPSSKPIIYGDYIDNLKYGTKINYFG